MSNHYHVVLHVDKERALAWSAQEVAKRWQQIIYYTEVSTGSIRQ